MAALLTPAEVAAILGVHVYTVRRWARDGTIDAVKMGRSIRIPAESVEALLVPMRAALGVDEAP